jgi:hypothetical protein
MAASMTFTRLVAAIRAHSPERPLRPNTKRGARLRGTPGKSRRQSVGLLDKALRNAAPRFQFESLGAHRVDTGSESSDPVI